MSSCRTGVSRGTCGRDLLKKRPFPVMDGLGILSTRAGRTMESQYRPAMKLQVKGARMDIFAIYSTRAPPSAYSPRWNTLAHRATSIAWIKGSGLQGIDNRDGNSRNVGWVRHAVYAATHRLGPRSGPPFQAVLQGVGLRPTDWWVTPQTAQLTHPTSKSQREMV